VRATAEEAVENNAHEEEQSTLKTDEGDRKEIPQEDSVQTLEEQTHEEIITVEDHPVTSFSPQPHTEHIPDTKQESEHKSLYVEKSFDSKEARTRPERKVFKKSRAERRRRRKRKKHKRRR
jgi:hypothetical protein